MNSCDERLEKLLNKAGRSIADLPNDYSMDDRLSARRAAWERFTKGTVVHKAYNYICHQADVIDELEIALHNTLVKLERAVCYLGESEMCTSCKHFEKPRHEAPCCNCQLSCVNWRELPEALAKMNRYYERSELVEGAIDNADSDV